MRTTNARQAVPEPVLPDPSGPDLPPDLVADVRRLATSHAAELIAFRRRLHAEPEPSYEEVATTDAVVERLLVEDLQPVRLSSGTGLVCDVGSGEPRVALRADIDALQLQETSDVPFRSRVPGIAHACGHDVHTAVVLGAGLVLHALHRDGRLDHGVRLIFEPGEEQVPGGAVDVIKDGWLEGLGRIYALHCQPQLDVGTAGARVGPITSASDLVELRLCGPGGHTARPDQTIDLVRVMGEVVSRLPEMVAEYVAAEGPSRLVFGSIAAGDAANVIPNSGVVRGSLRTPVLAAWDLMPEALEACLQRLLGPTGVEWTLHHVRGVAPVENDAGATETLARAARAALGQDAVVEAEQSWGGDSFGWFTRVVPGSYLRLGTHDPTWPERSELHNAAFRVDERAIAHGAQVLALAALAGWRT